LKPALPVATSSSTLQKAIVELVWTSCPVGIDFELSHTLISSSALIFNTLAHDEDQSLSLKTRSATTTFSPSAAMRMSLRVCMPRAEKVVGRPLRVSRQALILVMTARVLK